jgi:hypothetical protein
MSGERRVTRRAELPKRVLIDGIRELPEGVLWLQLPALGAAGEFPRAASPEGCDAALLVGLALTGASDMDLWCTREEAHEGPHVAHAGRGLPLAAWVDDPATVAEVTS